MFDTKAGGFASNFLWLSTVNGDKAIYNASFYRHTTTPRKGNPPHKGPPLGRLREVFDGLEGVSVGGFTDAYFERAVAAVALLQRGPLLHEWNLGGVLKWGIPKMDGL
jgi:hypothetical protein